MVSFFKNYKKVISLLIIISIIILLLVIFFIKNYYKNFNLGNNMSNKNIEEIEKYILNISSYEAEIIVQVESNKNTNKYVIYQKYIAPNLSKQIVLEPNNIKGLEIVYDGQNLNINNSKLNLNKIYENYEYIMDNTLCLESFISNYSGNNSSKKYEENEYFVFEVELNSENKYHKIEKLYINKETGKPTKLLIQDINEKVVVYILYNEIKINNLEKNDIN